MSNLRFASPEHRDFFLDMMGEARRNDCYVRVCRLAFNLWNGYTDPEHSNAYSPEDLFCCEFAPYFMEGVKIRYPKYCRELPPVRKQAEPAR